MKLKISCLVLLLLLGSAKSKSVAEQMSGGCVALEEILATKKTQNNSLERSQKIFDLLTGGEDPKRILDRPPTEEELTVMLRAVYDIATDVQEEDGDTFGFTLDALENNSHVRVLHDLFVLLDALDDPSYNFLEDLDSRLTSLEHHKHKIKKVWKESSLNAEEQLNLMNQHYKKQLKSIDDNLEEELKSIDTLKERPQFLTPSHLLLTDEQKKTLEKDQADHIKELKAVTEKWARTKKEEIKKTHEASIDSLEKEINKIKEQINKNIEYIKKEKKTIEEGLAKGFEKSRNEGLDSFISDVPLEEIQGRNIKGMPYYSLGIFKAMEKTEHFYYPSDLYPSLKRVATQFFRDYPIYMFNKETRKEFLKSMGEKLKKFQEAAAQNYLKVDMTPNAWILSTDKQNLRHTGDKKEEKLWGIVRQIINTENFWAFPTVEIRSEGWAVEDLYQLYMFLHSSSLNNSLLEKLKLHRSGFKRLPKEINKLTSLRTLDLSDSKSLETLPASIKDLQNSLQSLVLKGASNLKADYNEGGYIGLKQLVEIFGDKVKLDEDQKKKISDLEPSTTVTSTTTTSKPSTITTKLSSPLKRAAPTAPVKTTGSVKIYSITPPAKASKSSTTTSTTSTSTTTTDSTTGAFTKKRETGKKEPEQK